MLRSILGRKSFFLQVFLAFLLILTLVTSVTFYFYSATATSFYRDQVAVSRRSDLRFLSVLNRRVIEFTEETAIYLSAMDEIDQLHRQISLRQSADPLEYIPELLDIIARLKVTVSENENFGSVSLYVRELDSFVSSDNGYEPYEKFAERGALSRLGSRENKPLWTEARYLAGGSQSQGRMVSYIFPLTFYTSKLNGAVIINVNEKAFLPDVGIVQSGDSVFILNGDGGLAGGAGEVGFIDMLPIEETGSSSAAEGAFVHNFGGEKMLLAYVKCETGWTYYSLSALTPLMENAYSLSIRTALTVFVLLLIGATIWFIVLRGIYHPVNTLIERVKTYTNFDLSEKNEFSNLSGAFDMLMKERSNLRSLADRNRKNAADKILTDLAHSIQNKPDIEMFRAMGYAGPVFLCAAVSIDHYEIFSTRFNAEHQEYLRRLFVNVFCRSVSSPGLSSVGCALSKDVLVFLINGQAIDREDASRQLELGLNEVLKVVPNTVTVGVSELFHSLEAMGDAYQEAVKALSEKLFGGCGRVYLYKGEPDGEPEKLSIESICAGFEHEAPEDMDNAIDALIDKISQSENITTDYAMVIFNQLIGRVLEYLLFKNVTLQEIFGSKQNLYFALSKKETLEEIRLWLKNTLRFISRYLTENENHEQQLLTKTLNYIQENYKRDLGIQTISEELKISYFTLRKLFSNRLNDSLLNYMNRLRIEEAKELLQNSDLTVNEITEILGYNSNQTFTRYFKKFEGTTPGDYRSKKRLESH